MRQIGAETKLPVIHVMFGLEPAVATATVGERMWWRADGEAEDIFLDRVLAGAPVSWSRSLMILELLPPAATFHEVAQGRRGPHLH
jgi:hypothetical protein